MLTKLQGVADIANLGKKSSRRLGVDITSDSVRILQLSPSGNRYRLDNYAIRPLPRNAVVEKNISNIDAVGETIADAITLMKPAIKDAAVAVAGSAVITKTIEMSASLTDAEMENQIVVEADQYIPYPLDEISIDFERQKLSGRNPELVEVLLAACRRENVDSRVAALEVGGLEAKVVDIEAYAVERAYTLLAEQIGVDADQCVAIVDVGPAVITLNVILQGKTIYTREQMLGGNTLGPFKETVVQQVSRTLQFFFSSSHYNEVDHIVLAGGVAVIEGLADLCRESLLTPVTVANPFTGTHIGSRVNKGMLENDAPALLIACGLAMWGEY